MRPLALVLINEEDATDTFFIPGMADEKTTIAAAPPAADGANTAAGDKSRTPQGRRHMSGRADKLTPELMAQVFARLAASESPRAIARSLRRDHGIKIEPQSIARYDPTNTHAAHAPGIARWVRRLRRAGEREAARRGERRVK